METPDDIRKGNEGGPYVEAGNAEESFLFQLAAHTDEPIMPPAKNKVGAKNLTPGELGLLKLWIDQGAKGTMRARQLVTWQAYQRENPPIYATAVNREGALRRQVGATASISTTCPSDRSSRSTWLILPSPSSAFTARRTRLTSAWSTRWPFPRTERPSRRAGTVRSSSGRSPLRPIGRDPSFPSPRASGWP